MLKQFQVMLYRLSQLILRNFEGKIYPYRIMCFNWMGRKHLILWNFFMTFLFSAQQVSTQSFLPFYFLRAVNELCPIQI